jgi:WD40 repeat protein
LRARSDDHPWYPEWSAWQFVNSSYVVVTCEYTITAVAPGADNRGAALFAYGLLDGTIQVWNSASSRLTLEVRPEKLFQPYRNGPFPAVKNIVVLDRNGPQLLIAAWRDGSIGVLDITTGEALGWWRDEGGDGVSALCAVPAGRDWRLVVATDDRSLRVFQLPDLKLLSHRDKATAAAIYSLAATIFEGSPAVISGGDAFRDGRLVDPHLVRVWRLSDLQLRWRSPKQDGTASQILVCMIGRKEWIVARDGGGDIVLHQPELGAMVSFGGFPPLFYHLCGAVPKDGAAMLLGFGGREFRYVLLRADGDEEKALSITREPLGVDVGHAYLDTVHSVNGRNAILGSSGRQLRLWDVSELLEQSESKHRAEGAFFDSNSLIRTLAADDARVVALSEVSELCCWSAAGKMLWKQSRSSGRLTEVALGMLDGRPIIVTGSEEANLAYLRRTTDILCGRRPN